MILGFWRARKVDSATQIFVHSTYFYRQELLILFFLTTRKVDQQETLILGFRTTRNVDSNQIQNRHSVSPLAFGDCRFPLCCFFVEQKQQNGSPNQQNGHTLQQSGTQKQQSGPQKQQSGCLRNNKMGLSSCIWFSTKPTFFWGGCLAWIKNCGFLVVASF